MAGSLSVILGIKRGWLRALGTLGGPFNVTCNFQADQCFSLFVLFLFFFFCFFLALDKRPLSGRLLVAMDCHCRRTCLECSATRFLSEWVCHY